jgi:predicted RNase H-like nuclease
MIDEKLKSQQNAKTAQSMVEALVSDTSSCHPSGHDFPTGDFLSVGIDGAGKWWVVVALKKNGFAVSFHENIREICEWYVGADAMLIDMPIGLNEGAEDKRPDHLVRTLMKGKASSVFPTPCRQAVYAKDYPDAARQNKVVLGKSLSKQSWAIVPKIREIDIFLSENQEWTNRLLESHPEYCFTLLNDDRPVLSRKVTDEGFSIRRKILSKYYSNTDAVLERYRKTAPNTIKSKRDDVVDALVLAVIGLLGLQYGFHSIPNPPYADTRGILMQMIGATIPYRS